MKMSEKLYACIISPANIDSLQAIGNRFAYRMEGLDDGIVFEISGLRKIFGTPEKISELIRLSMIEDEISGNVAIAENPKTAILQARNTNGTTVNKPLDQISLDKIGLDRDQSSVFNSLGLRNVDDLKKIPETELIARYGSEIRQILETVNDHGRYVLTPNFKENHVSWSYQLDFPVLNFEQLVFIIRHGLEKVFLKTSGFGLKTEELRIVLHLEDKTVKQYTIKISFPTLEIKFWLKIINLKLSNDAPQSGILSLEIFAFFIRPRSIQKSLFSAAVPQPESLLLTVMKIKKLIGNENVGIPIIINQRLSNAFGLDCDKMPSSLVGAKETNSPSVAFSYFHPPLEAEVTVANKRLVFLRTKIFKGKVNEYGGGWIDSGQWWSESQWLTEEWDVELEDGGLYRLIRNGGNWFVTGEYD